MTSLLDGRAHGAAVLVTGATGYVAGHLIDRLLEAGARVRATVRDPSDTDKIAHLLKMAERAPGSITFSELTCSSREAMTRRCRDAPSCFTQHRRFSTWQKCKTPSATSSIRP